MTDNTKNARHGGETVTGEDQTPERNSIKMNTTKTTNIHPGIAPILEGLRALPEDHSFFLDPGDFGFEDHGVEWVRPLSDFAGSRTWDQLQDDIEDLQPHFFGRWYRLDGSMIPRSERSAEWMAAEWSSIGDTEKQAQHAVASSAGGFLWISDGVWYPVSETTVGDEPAFVFVQREELQRRRDAAREVAREAFRSAHAAAILAVRPAWAEDLDVFEIDTDRPELVFRRRVGRVDVSQVAHVIDGVCVLSSEGPSIYVADAENLTVEHARETADALRAIADAVEVVQA